MTADELFSVSILSCVLCAGMKFHSSKPYFLVTGFTLIPIPMKTCSMNDNLIEYLQKEDIIPRQNLPHCCSLDLMIYMTIRLFPESSQGNFCPCKMSLTFDLSDPT